MLYGLFLELIGRAMLNMDCTWLRPQGPYLRGHAKSAHPETKGRHVRALCVTYMAESSTSDKSGERSVRDLPPRGVQQGPVVGAEFTPVV